MNLHDVPVQKFSICAASTYSPDHGDEASRYDFDTEAERHAFEQGFDFAAGDDYDWWYANKPGTYFYCNGCEDWMFVNEGDDFDALHDEHYYG